MSESDELEKVEEKAELYLHDGVRVVWVLDAERQRAYVHTPDNLRRTVEIGTMLTLPDILPDFAVDLRQMFGEAV
jgi:Uma2 family endonuclease